MTSRSNEALLPRISQQSSTLRKHFNTKHRIYLIVVQEIIKMSMKAMYSLLLNHKIQRSLITLYIIRVNYNSLQR